MSVESADMVGGRRRFRNDSVGRLGLEWPCREGNRNVPLVRRIEAQPESHNNISPIHVPEGGILFTSDLPVGGPANRHLYPPRDEYELMPTTLGYGKSILPPGPDGLRHAGEAVLPTIRRELEVWGVRQGRLTESRNARCGLPIARLRV